MPIIRRAALLAALSMLCTQAWGEKLSCEPDKRDDKLIREAWFLAAASGRVDSMIDLWYRRCVTDINLIKQPPGNGKHKEDRRTALIVAADASQLAVVQLLLLLKPEKKDELLGWLDHEKRTALIAAAHAGDRSVVEILQSSSTSAEEKERAAKAALAARYDGIAECIRLGNCQTFEPHRRSYVADAWKLGVDGLPLDAFQPHRPMYLIVRESSSVNRSPTSPVRAVPYQDFGRYEAKFQVSFKNELVSPKTFADLIGESGHKLRLWVAYTQQSNWQVFNGGLSRPFRETNYEPEVILSYDNREKARPDEPRPRSGFHPDVINVGFVHQSNGRSDPESRSWNRVYLQGGWQVNEDLAVLPRVWAAMSTSDNPDIERWQRGDVTVRFDTAHWGRFSLLARHNLNFKHNREFFQLDWRLPWTLLGAKLHFQATSGYGENLLDYNHRQRTVGVGVSVWEW